jgi:hypothetical protein
MDGNAGTVLHGQYTTLERLEGVVWERIGENWGRGNPFSIYSTRSKKHNGQPQRAHRARGLATSPRGMEKDRKSNRPRDGK